MSSIYANPQTNTVAQSIREPYTKILSTAFRKEQKSDATACLDPAGRAACFGAVDKISKTFESLSPNNNDLRLPERSAQLIGSNPDLTPLACRYVMNRIFQSSFVFIGSQPYCHNLARQITDNDDIAKHLSIFGSSLIQSSVCLQGKKNIFKDLFKHGSRSFAFNLPYYLLLEKTKHKLEDGNNQLTYQQRISNGAVLGFGSGVASSIVDYPSTVFAKCQQQADKVTVSGLRQILKTDWAKVLAQPGFKAAAGYVGRKTLPYGIYGAIAGLGYGIAQATFLDKTVETKKPFVPEETEDKHSKKL